MRVLHVPGHTAGSIALVREDGVVFSGDTVLGDAEGNAQPPSEVAFFWRCASPFASATVPANCALSSCEPHEMQ